MIEQPYRYQITRNGRRVGSIEAEYHGRAEWQLDDPSVVIPGNPRTMEQLDAVLYAAGYEVMPEE